jgi:hypothetical protein
MAALIVVGLVVWIVAFAIEGNAVPAGDQRAIDAIEAQGFRDVELGGAAMFSCGKNESSRKFVATNPADKRVEGTVCCGLTGVAKGCTLRW